jgi:hypothetical protein
MFVWCFMMGKPHLGEGDSKNVTQDSLLPCPRSLILRMITPLGSNLHITTFFLHLCTCLLQHQIAPMSLSLCCLSQASMGSYNFHQGKQGYFKVEFVWWQLQWLYLIIFHIWTYPQPPPPYFLLYHLCVYVVEALQHRLACHVPMFHNHFSWSLFHPNCCLMVLPFSYVFDLFVFCSFYQICLEFMYFPRS